MAHYFEWRIISNGAGDGQQVRKLSLLDSPPGLHGTLLPALLSPVVPIEDHAGDDDANERACQGREEGVQGCIEWEHDAYEPDQQCCRVHMPVI